MNQNSEVKKSSSLLIELAGDRKHYRFPSETEVYIIYPIQGNIRYVSHKEQYCITVADALNKGVFDLPYSEAYKQANKILNEHYAQNDYEFVIGKDVFKTSGLRLNPDNLIEGMNVSHQGQMWVILYKELLPSETGEFMWYVTIERLSKRSQKRVTKKTLYKNLKAILKIGELSGDFTPEQV